jgi:hypothetical protein
MRSGAWTGWLVLPAVTVRWYERAGAAGRARGNPDVDAWMWWLVAFGVWLALNFWILPRLGVPT